MLFFVLNWVSAPRVKELEYMIGYSAVYMCLQNN